MGHIVPAILCASLLPPLASFEEWFQRPFILPRVAAALIVGPAVSGLMAATFFHHAGSQSFFLAFSNWAVSDAVGIAAVLPLALSLRSVEMRNLFHPDTLARTIIVLSFVFTCTTLIFTVNTYPLLFVLYPVLLLVDSLLAFPGTAISIMFVSLTSVYYTKHGMGPFGTWSGDRLLSRDLALQLYLGFHMVALLPASILFAERRRLVQELSLTNSRLGLLASVDALTGIANRRSFDQRFVQEVSRAMRVQMPLTLLMIDIDYFKQFNDLYGHPAGDDCLRTVSAVLVGCMQRSQDFVARLGGEEFAVLLPYTPEDGGYQMGERIRVAIMAEPFQHKGTRLKSVTVSIGCSTVTPTRGSDPFEVVRLADLALYQAKKLGKNRVVISR